MLTTTHVQYYRHYENGMTIVLNVFRLVQQYVRYVTEADGILLILLLNKKIQFCTKDNDLSIAVLNNTQKVASAQHLVDQ